MVSIILETNRKTNMTYRTNEQIGRIL